MKYYLKPQYYHIYGLIERHCNICRDNKLSIVRLNEIYLITMYGLRSEPVTTISMEFDPLYRIKNLILYDDGFEYTIISNYESTGHDHKCNKYICTDPIEETEITLRTDLYLFNKDL